MIEAYGAYTESMNLDDGWCMIMVRNVVLLLLTTLFYYLATTSTNIANRIDLLNHI